MDLCELAHKLSRRPVQLFGRRPSSLQAPMRRALNVVLVLGGILVSIMASPGKSVSTKDDFRNVVVVDGHHVALPTAYRLERQ